MTGEMKADQRELRDDELDAVNGGTVMELPPFNRTQGYCD